MAITPQDADGGDRAVVAVTDGTAAGGAAPVRKDERFVQVSWLTKLMQRPSWLSSARS